MLFDSSDSQARPGLEALWAGFTEHELIDTTWSAGDLPTGRWWNGPLDVEGLARGSIELCCATANALIGQRGQVSSDNAQIAAAFASYTHLRIDAKSVVGFAPASGFFKTTDGWIRTHANYPHHEAALRRALGLSSVDQMPKALLDLNAEEAEDRIIAAGGVAATVRTRSDWLQSHPGIASTSGSWAQFQLSDCPDAVSWKLKAASGDLPLSGLRVLDLTRVIAGPTATRTLAALGAQVLRIDPPQIPEISDQFIDTGFGKRSAVADLREPRDLAQIHELLETADAIVLGYRPGALELHGLSAQNLRHRYPNLIIAEVSAWGFSGPWSQRRGFDSIVQAASGIADVYRKPDGAPGALPVQALDHAVGYGVAAAVMALARARIERGLTGSVRFNLARTASALFELPVPQDPQSELGAPKVGRMDSIHGNLRYVLPAFAINGRNLDYASPPGPYGQDGLSWR